MADDLEFQERFSTLTNALQVALNQMRERAIHARQNLETPLGTAGRKRRRDR